jgi:hypothetical protein
MAVRAVLFPVTPYFVQLEGKNAPSEEALRRAIASALNVDLDTVSVEIADDASDIDTPVLSDDDDDDDDANDDDNDQADADDDVEDK